MHSREPPIIHCDLKGVIIIPIYCFAGSLINSRFSKGNILISSDGVAHIGDFGLSRVDSPYASPHIRTNAMISASSASDSSSIAGAGTYRYMAPELFDTDVPRRSLASDVYAFGRVMEEVCMTFSCNLSPSNFRTYLGSYWKSTILGHEPLHTGRISQVSQNHSARNTRPTSW